MRKLLCIFCLSIIVVTVFSQKRRLALVIGNSAYEKAGALRSPINDAYAMRTVLRQSGFEVLDYYDLNHDEMLAAINDFGLKMRDYDVGLFYFAGHGIQKNGENYLIPVDADIAPGKKIEDVCIRADRALLYMDVAGSDVNIVILDACRNSPFERSWNQSLNGRGLAAMDAPKGMLIAFATDPGNIILDRNEGSGIFTNAIVENMRIPDVNIVKLFKNVRRVVSQRSDNFQTPWISSSIRKKFYIKRSTDNYGYDDAVTTEQQTGIEDRNETYSYSPAKNTKRLNRTGIILQSVAVPGLGLSRVTGKPHWLKGVAGYGCIGGSIYLNQMAINTYNDEFLSAYEPDEAALLLKKSTNQDNFSEMLAYTAIGIWTIDIVWTIIRSSDLKKDINKSRDLGLSVGSGIDPLFKVPVVEFVYRFW